MATLNNRIIYAIRNFLLVVLVLSPLLALRAHAQTNSLPGTTTRTPSSTLVSQAVTDTPRINPAVIPTDVTPLIFSGERGLLSRDLRFSLMKRLPERLWFNCTTEVSQRLETNPFFTRSGGKTDYAFRVMPNITLGYNVFKRSSIYCNWFIIKDVFAKNAKVLNFPLTQSLSLGLRHDLPVGRKTNVQFDFQARELWQTSHLHQADFLPAINVTHVVNPNFVLFGSSVLQLRGREYFACPTREIDPFFSAGFLYRKGDWNFTATNTYVLNFRSPPFNSSIPRQGNQSMISDYELSRPISKKLPGVVGFIRAEPVWNFDSHRQPGLSGFDFRLFGGIRIAISKQPYYATIEQLKDQIRDLEQQESGTTKDPRSSMRPRATKAGNDLQPQKGLAEAETKPGVAGLSPDY